MSTISQEQRQALGSISHGIEAKALQDEFRTTQQGKECLPIIWRNDPANDEKARKLLSFFKNEFFTWVNQPNCIQCEKNDQMKIVSGRGPITNEEKVGLASRVEVYACQRCEQKETCFPRYNNPKTLMNWRKGRCGEWANCFCALAVSAGFQTRFILDLTDHVWGEIYSTDQQRWIHCDPCENSFDAPLMYESGWGKSLSWVFAFESGGKCKDVTRRYSRKWDSEMLQRRIKYSSMALTRMLLIYVPSRTVESENLEFKRCVEETLKSHSQNNNKEEEDKIKLKPEEARGRISGSEEWRRARGELGDEKKEFQVRYRFLIESGKTPNEAAVQALREMMEENNKITKKD